MTGRIDSGDVRFREANPNIFAPCMRARKQDEKSRTGTTPKETISALMSMTDLEIAQVRADVFAASRRRDSYHHGEQHWLAVAHAGLHIAPSVDGCDPLVVLPFALFHDAMRENEHDDPEHGLRSGRLARRLLQNKLAAERWRLLIKPAGITPIRGRATIRRSPCAGTPIGSTSGESEPSPDPTFLSTDAARSPAPIRQARLSMRVITTGNI
jgi:hypothetical protein